VASLAEGKMGLFWDRVTSSAVAERGGKVGWLGSDADMVGLSVTP
jgi:hypothetical protein